MHPLRRGRTAGQEGEARKRRVCYGDGGEIWGGGGAGAARLPMLGFMSRFTSRSNECYEGDNRRTSMRGAWNDGVGDKEKRRNPPYY